MAVTVQQGSKGIWVEILQYAIGADPDGIFGPKTKQLLQKYQKDNGLDADGIAGNKTWTKIQDKAPTLRFGATGNYVYMLEVFLDVMKKDGIYTREEIIHVKTYQGSKKLEQDGIVGKKTWAALFGISNGGNSDKAVQPVIYRQYDSRWGSVVFTRKNTYNKKQTIANSGCGPTSMAMIVATWWDKKITPVEMCKLAVDNNFRTYNSGTDWAFFKFCAQKYKASKFIQTSSFETMRNCLVEGGYVVVLFGPGKFTNGGHYCVAWKDDGNKIYINDPASASSSRTYGTYNEVRNQSKQYFCFWK